MGGPSAYLPPGFRFHPTDEELVGYYLKRKLEGLQFELEVIPVVDFYKFDPWELPEKSFLPKRDMEWFFFCPRDRKYTNGLRTNRATKAGYWKATGKDRKVACQSSVTGYRKTLVFYKGRAPLEDRTNWMMHEYRLSDESSQGSSNFHGAFALCRVIKRNEHSQRTSDSHRKPKAKMDADGPSNGDFASVETSNDSLKVSSDVSCQVSNHYNESHHTNPTPLYEVTPTGKSMGSFSVSSELIFYSSKELSQVEQMVHEYLQPYDLPSPSSSWRPYNHQEISPCSSYSNFMGEVELADDFSHMGCTSLDYEGRSYMGFSRQQEMPYEGHYDRERSEGH